MAFFSFFLANFGADYGGTPNPSFLIYTYIYLHYFFTDMTLFQILSKSINPESLLMGIATVLAGTAAAGLHGNLEILPAILCMLFAVFAQGASNLAHRYMDYRTNSGENIDDNIPRESDSGLSVGLILKEGYYSMMLLATMIGFAIATMTGWWAVVLALIIFIIGWATNAGPMLVRTPWSLLSTFLLFGPIGVIGTSLVQSLHEATDPLGWYDLSPAVFIGCVMGLMATNCHLVYNFATYRSDLRNSKRTFSIVFGRKAARILFIIIGLSAFFLMLTMCLTLKPERWGLDMIAPSISLIINVYIWWHMKSTSRHLAVQLIDLSIFKLVILSGLTLVFFLITGDPDDSNMTFFGF